MIHFVSQYILQFTVVSLTPLCYSGPVAGIREKKNVYKSEEMDLNEIGCGAGRCFELTQECVQLWALVLAVLNLRVLRPLV
jgi:hypothetical protein